jgi:hypothetical protein
MRLRRRRNRSGWLVGGVALALVALALPTVPSMRRYLRMTRM